MYPRILELPFGFTIYSFGFMVAMSILTASWLLARELTRLQKVGTIAPIKVKRKPQAADRNKREKRKDRKANRAKYETVQPADFVGTITVIAAVMGIVGAKLFHILEHPGDFIADPVGMIFSRGGLTFYGGLVLAGFSVAYYARKKGLSVPILADAIAPALMLGYGIGRMGCHLAGDGDWGIQSYLSEKPGWIPDWLWSETYPNNISNVVLPGDGVYPTPIYEFAMAFVLFAVLWSLRKHPFIYGWLFSLYLIFNGIERFLIEKIRVNEAFDLFGLTVTQAEIISVLFIVVGVVGLVRTSKRRDPAAAAPA